MEKHALTRPESTTQGASTMPANTRLMALGGDLGSGLKVCCISGRGWKVASSGCCGGGADAGRTRSNKSVFRGECLKDPTMRETRSGEVVVGGRDDGGRAIFYK